MRRFSLQICASVSLVAAVFASATPAIAGDDENACGAVMCLAGRAMGANGGSECDKYIQKYFAIQVVKDGIFRPDKTAKKRRQFLDQCQSADNGSKDSVSNGYGSSQGG